MGKGISYCVLPTCRKNRAQIFTPACLLRAAGKSSGVLGWKDGKMCFVMAETPRDLYFLLCDVLKVTAGAEAVTHSTPGPGDVSV